MMQRHREEQRTGFRIVLKSTSSLAAVGYLLAGCAAFAADVTPDRLANADKEPQNWLMNHRTYDGQRRGALPGPELRANSPW
jgi:hypothetical protein